MGRWVCRCTMGSFIIMIYTQWFDGYYQKPDHVGPYQVKYSPCSCSDETPKMFQYWNGRYFGPLAHTPEEASNNMHSLSVFQNNMWRGLVKEKFVKNEDTP